MYSFKNASIYIDGKGIIKTDISFEDSIISLNSCLGEVISLPKNAIVFAQLSSNFPHRTWNFVQFAKQP